MYSLVRCHNDEYSVVLTKNVHNVGSYSECTVKCKGGATYSAFSVSRNDDKAYLLKLREEKGHHNTNLSFWPIKPSRKLAKCKPPIKTKSPPTTHRKSKIKNKRLPNLAKSKNIPPYSILNNEEEIDLLLPTENEHAKLKNEKQFNFKNEKLQSQQKSNLLQNFEIAEIPNSTIEKIKEHSSSHFSPPNRKNLTSLKSKSIDMSSVTVIRNTYKTPMEVICIANSTSEQNEKTNMDKFESAHLPKSAIEISNGNTSTDFSLVDHEIVGVIETPISCIDKNDSLLQNSGVTGIPNFIDIRSIDIEEGPIADYISNSTIEKIKEHTSHFRSVNGKKLSAVKSKSSDIGSVKTNVSMVLMDIDKTSMEVTHIPNKVNLTTEIYNSVEDSIHELLESFDSEYSPNSKVKMSDGNVPDFSLADHEIIGLLETPSSCVDKHNGITPLQNSGVTEETNLIDTSSIDIAEGSASEYISNSTIEKNTDMQISTDTGLEEKNKSVEVIADPINITSLHVPHSNNMSKKHFCIFCKTLQCKIARHLLSIHKNEKQIKIALGFSKKSKERLKIIGELRKKGDFIHNTSEELNSGVLIVSRQQQSKSTNKADDYICCTICKAFLSKNTFRIHFKKCGGKRNLRNNFIEGRRLTQFVHVAATPGLRTKIFPVMRNDEITKSLRYDELIIKFGNKLSEKYTHTHQHDMIRANLRLLGRFKLELRKLDPEVMELKQMFKPCMFDKCVTALRTVAKWDQVSGFGTPGVASNLSNLIKKCAEIQRTEFIKSQCEDLKADLEKFLLLWEAKNPALIKQALEDQITPKKINKIVLPSKEDIQKLHDFLRNKIYSSINALSNEFSTTAWVELVQSSLIFIHIFNRTSADETERLTLQHYSNKKMVADNAEKGISENISPESILLAKQFVRITLREKLGGSVSILLSPLCKKAIDVIIKYRDNAGIPEQNEYIFSRPGTSNLSEKYYRACPLLEKYAYDCGAEVPDSLRRTTSRKHIATCTSLLNIEDATIYNDMHKSIYRIAIPLSDLKTVSKVLLAAVGGEEGDDGYIEEEDNCVEDIGNNEGNGSNDEVQGSDEENTEAKDTRKVASTSAKRKLTPPVEKITRCRWTTEEKQAIDLMFGNIRALQKLPSLALCRTAIKKYSALTKRTPQQIKTWIDNQRRYK